MTFGPYEIIQLDAQSWCIESDIVRSFLFAGTERAMLVDTMNIPGPLAEAVRSLTDKPVILVNTHADPDHIGANGSFAEAWMHPAEFAYYAQTRNAGFAAPRPLQDGETLELGGRCFEVILVSGHTPGSIALLEQATGILVGGDCISTSPIYLFGAVRSLEALIPGLTRLQTRADEIRYIYPAHGAFPLDKAQLAHALSCAKQLLHGTLTPQEPPHSLPAKMYCADGASIFFSPEDLKQLQENLPNFEV